jgi:probable blue pigment (indigoidine) exporter
MIAARTALAPVAWGTTYLTVTELLPDGRPLLVAALRVLPASIALLVVGARTGWWRPVGGEWRSTAALALCNFGLFFPLLSVAVYRLPGGVAAAAGGLQPLLVALLAWPVTGQRPRLRTVGIGVVAVAGVALVVLRPGAGFDAVGVAAAAGANVAFALGVVLTKRLSAPANRVAATGWQLLLAAGVLVPLALVVEGTPPALTTTNLAGFAYLSLAGTAVAFLLWFDGIGRLPVAAPPLLGLAAPLTGATLGWVVLGQSLSASQLVGFALALSAIAYGAVVASRPVVVLEEVGPARRVAPLLDRLPVARHCASA